MTTTIQLLPYQTIDHLILGELLSSLLPETYSTSMKYEVKSLAQTNVKKTYSTKESVEESLLVALHDAAQDAISEAAQAFHVAEEKVDALCGKPEFDQAFEERLVKRNRWLKAKEYEKNVSERISKFEVGFTIDDLFSVEI